MKTRFNMLIKIIVIACLTITVFLNFPLFEGGDTGDVQAKDKKTKTPKDDQQKKLEEALKEYEKAMKEIEKKDWKKAKDKLNKALEKYPQPAEGYYPYLYLGLASLKLGDMNAAQQYLQLSQQFGVAPKSKINEYMSIIISQTQKTQVVQQPQPTATPKPIVVSIAPTATPQPVVVPVQPAAIPTPTPQMVVISVPQPTPEILTPQADAIPAIAITSVIPERTVDAILTITGVATDDQGIADIKVSVRKPGTKAIIAVPRPEIAQEQFEATVPLEVGQNEIVVEAIDTIGQVGERTFLVIRDLPAQPVTSEVKAGSLPATETSPEAEQTRGDVYAVIIGIGDFQDTRIPPLRFTVNDAQEFYNLLIDPNYGGIPQDHIQLLLDAEATDRNIKTAIGKWLSQRAKAEDTVIIYYSGHGAPEDEETYWVTYNADIDNLYSTALSNNEIYDMLNRVEAKRMITFLDSCYSAATVNRQNRTKSLQIEIPWEKFSGEGRVTISASNGKQLSLEMEAYEHGVFTYYVLEGLKGRADGIADTERDGIIEVEELWGYVRNKVTDTAKKQNNTQTPVLQGSLTAGIPLTYDLVYLEELQQQRLQAKQAKQAKLQALFEQGKLRADHFDCAFQMIEAGQSNGYLDGLLDGGISPETFSKLFTCE